MNRTGLVLVGAVVAILGYAIVYNGSQSLAAGTTAAPAFPYGDTPGTLGFIASLVPGVVNRRAGAFGQPITPKHRGPGAGGGRKHPHPRTNRRKQGVR